MLTSCFIDKKIFLFKYILLKSLGHSSSSSYVPQSTVVETISYVPYIIFISYRILKDCSYSYSWWLNVTQWLASGQYKSEWKWSVTCSLSQLRTDGNSLSSFFPDHVPGEKILALWVTFTKKVLNKTNNAGNFVWSHWSFIGSVTAAEFSLLWLIQYQNIHKQQFFFK